jgi:hypothetical protein
MQNRYGELHYQEYDEVCFLINNNSNKIEKRDHSTQHQVTAFRWTLVYLIARFVCGALRPLGINPDLSYEQQQADCFSLELKGV